MMFNLNQDVKSRDEIIFGEYDESKYSGGCRHFKNLTLSKLKTLVEENFIDLNDAQNNCPTVKDILDFISKYPDYTTHGYAVSIERDDYRVSLEGIEKNREADSMEELKDFVDMFRFADDFSVYGEMYCWFD